MCCRKRLVKFTLLTKDSAKHLCLCYPLAILKPATYRVPRKMLNRINTCQLTLNIIDTSLNKQTFFFSRKKHYQLFIFSPFNLCYWRYFVKINTYIRIVYQSLSTVCLSMRTDVWLWRLVLWVLCLSVGGCLGFCIWVDNSFLLFVCFFYFWFSCMCVERVLLQSFNFSFRFSTFNYRTKISTNDLTPCCTMD